jgi:perosamine synthetase
VRGTCRPRPSGHLSEYIHDEIGYNYRMTNIQAALGLAQLESLPWVLRRKAEIEARYRTAFEGVVWAHS